MHRNQGRSPPPARPWGSNRPPPADRRTDAPRSDAPSRAPCSSPSTDSRQSTGALICTMVKGSPPIAKLLDQRDCQGIITAQQHQLCPGGENLPRHHGNGSPVARTTRRDRPPVRQRRPPAPLRAGPAPEDQSSPCPDRRNRLQPRPGSSRLHQHNKHQSRGEGVAQSAPKITISASSASSSAAGPHGDHETSPRRTYPPAAPSPLILSCRNAEKMPAGNAGQEPTARKSNDQTGKRRLPLWESAFRIPVIRGQIRRLR